MKVIKVGDRVTLPNHTFLSGGEIIKIFDGVGAVVKLDVAAPNEYAYNTSEVLMFESEIELVEE